MFSLSASEIQCALRVSRSKFHTCHLLSYAQIAEQYPLTNKWSDEQFDVYPNPIWCQVAQSRMGSLASPYVIRCVSDLPPPFCSVFMFRCDPCANLLIIIKLPIRFLLFIHRVSTLLSLFSCAIGDGSNCVVVSRIASLHEIVMVG